MCKSNKVTFAWLVKNLEEQEQRDLDLAHWFPCNSIYKMCGSLVIGSIQRARIFLLQSNMELRIKPNIQTTAFVMSSNLPLYRCIYMPL